MGSNSLLSNSWIVPKISKIFKAMIKNTPTKAMRLQ
jgi:hypothetical protein